MRARSLFARQRGERLLLRNAKYVDLMCPLRPSDGSIIHVRILLSRRRSPCRRRRRTHLPGIAFSAREHYCAQDDFVDVAGIPSSFGSSPIESTPPTTLAAEALELFTFFNTSVAGVAYPNVLTLIKGSGRPPMMHFVIAVAPPSRSRNRKTLISLKLYSVSLERSG